MCHGVSELAADYKLIPIFFSYHLLTFLQIMSIPPDYFDTEENIKNMIVKQVVRIKDFFPSFLDSDGFIFIQNGPKAHINICVRGLYNLCSGGLTLSFPPRFGKGKTQIENKKKKN